MIVEVGFERSDGEVFGEFEDGIGHTECLNGSTLMRVGHFF